MNLDLPAVLPLLLFRGALLGAGGLAIGTGITLTYEGDHRLVTLLAWYLLGVLLLLVGSAFWFSLHRREARSKRGEFAFGPGDLARQHTSLGTRGRDGGDGGRVYGGAMIGEATRRSQVAADRVPKLSLGTVHVPRHSQRVELGEDAWDVFHGRVLRVPVINEAGTETATSVQALLTFMPEDTQGTWSPRDPALAEWDTEPVATIIDIPGNGQPQLFDVAFVLDAEHVCVHQWTRHSRQAKLHGYGIAGLGLIQVEVRAESNDGGPAPSVTDTLRIEALDGLLSAQWESEGRTGRSNWAPWPNPPMMGPPPGS